MEKILLIILISIISIIIIIYVVYSFVYNKLLNSRLNSKKRYNFPRPLMVINILLITLISLSFVFIYIGERNGLFIKDVMPKITGEFEVSYYDLNNSSSNSAINIYKPLLISESEIVGYSKTSEFDSELFTLILYMEESYDKHREFIIYFNYKGIINYDKVKSGIVPIRKYYNSEHELIEHEFTNSIAYKGSISTELNIKLTIDFVDYILENNEYISKLVFEKEFILNFNKW